jgi:CRP-like cAMP-binding protein
VAERMTNTRAPSPNRILACLPDADLCRLQADLQPVDLPVRLQLERANQPIQHIYSPESGFASVVANGSSKRNIEVGLIGREGVTGLAVAMGTDRAPHETFMQAAGHGQRMTAESFRQWIDKSAELHRCLLQCAHIFLVQAAQTRLANGRGKLEERLARWLLMAHDRIEDDDLELTQEFLAIMLGVRRPGVSVAVGQLEKQGLIRTGRGHITIVDRDGLIDSTNGLYGVPENEFERLFGSAR